jgi:CRP-like cAMP-binding protein
MTAAHLPLNIPALLARTPLFQGLAPAEIELIAGGTREVALDRGAILFRRGDPSEGFYLVVYGQIKLSFISPQGAEKVVEIIAPGQTFGEAVMFMDKPYPVMATALADSQLLHIGRDALFAELAQDPKLGRKMLAGLSMKLHRMLADMESISTQSARERVIGYLLREIPDDAPPGREITITLSSSKGTIASRLNVTQEHFSRVLHELEREDLLSIEGRNVTLRAAFFANAPR